MTTPSAERAQGARPIHSMRMAREVLPDLVLPALLILLGIWLRLYRITGQSLWFDEGISLHYSNCSDFGGCLQAMLDTNTSERFNLLYFLLLHGWRQMAGSSELALRSLSLVLGAATLPLTWLAARRLFDAQHALWSLAFLATSAFGVFYAQEVRPYAFFLAITALQLWLFAEARRDDASLAARVGFWLVTAVAAWAGLFSVVFNVALALADLAADRRLRRWFRLWLPAVVLCLPAVAYYGLAMLDTPPSDISVPHTSNPLFNLMFVIYGHLVGQFYGPPLDSLRGSDKLGALADYWPQLAVFALLAATAFGRMLWLAARGRLFEPGETLARIVVYAALLFLALSFGVAIVTKLNWLPRHAFPLHILIALLLPLAGRPATERPAGRHGWTAPLVLAFCGLNLLSIYNYDFKPEHSRDDYRDVARYLVEQSAARPAILLSGVPLLLRYYGDDRTIDGTSFDPEKLDAEVAAAAPDRPEVLLVVNREYYYGPPGTVQKAMGRAYRLEETRRFQNFVIYRYAK